MKKTLFALAMLLVTSHSFAAVSPKQLVAFLESMPHSYSFRSVCVSHDLVIGSYSTGRAWHTPGKSFVAYGSLNQFPKSQTEFSPQVAKSFPYIYEMPQGPEDWKRFTVLKNKAKGTGDTIYATTGTINVSGKTLAADCAFESGGRLE